MRAVLLCLLCLLWMPLAVCAQSAQPMPQDPVANKRAMQLAEELRCLVCQNQTIADSNAELAVDLRRQIREQIAQGRDDGQIMAYMVERYGDFVLYRPPLKATTLFLWFGPPVLLLLGIIFLLRYLNSRRKRVEQQPLSAGERSAAAALLGNDNEGERK
ncbi:MAG: cytochrome c-type biogenesis protein CcmH [Betaproteobacteria bacterium]|nr:cytochrome c-type biogenesis protein CcmH [Betaproteobacteria bacterium]